MNQITTTAKICLDDPLGFTYKISRVDYIVRDDESYAYVFAPDYSVIDLLASDLFQGIPGLDLDLRKPRYVRENMTPVFISERTPGENREDLWKLLQDCGMDHLNRLEWLIRTRTRYGGDLLYARQWTEEDEKHSVDFTDIEKSETRSAAAIRRLLREICAGNDIRADGFRIDDGSRKAYYSLLMSIYRKEKGYIDRQRADGIRKSAAQGQYRGRKPIPIDGIRFMEMKEKYEHGTVTARDAAAALGMSRSTFFRKLRKRY